MVMRIAMVMRMSPETMRRILRLRLLISSSLLPGYWMLWLISGTMKLPMVAILVSVLITARMALKTIAMSRYLLTIGPARQTRPLGPARISNIDMDDLSPYYIRNVCQHKTELCQIKKDLSVKLFHLVMDQLAGILGNSASGGQHHDIFIGVFRVEADFHRAANLDMFRHFRQRSAGKGVGALCFGIGPLGLDKIAPGKLGNSGVHEDSFLFYIDNGCTDCLSAVQRGMLFLVLLSAPPAHNEHGHGNNYNQYNNNDHSYFHKTILLLPYSRYESEPALHRGIVS